MAESNEEIYKLVQDKINLGKNLIEILLGLKDVPGVQRVQNIINEEVKLLDKIKNNPTKAKYSICKTSIVDFKLFVKALCIQKRPNRVYCSFPVKIGEESLNVNIDIVCDNELKWINVIPRNVGLLFCVDGCMRSETILDLGNKCIMAAAQNLVCGRPPKVAFYFGCSLDYELQVALRQSGIDVITHFYAEDNSSDTEAEAQEDGNNILNLDVTAMIAYISELTNGGSNWIFEEKTLTKQAETERKTPLKPILDDLFDGKKLVCCETAIKIFKQIVNLIGGPKEKQRSEELLKKIVVYPDVEDIAEDLKGLSLSNQITPSSFKVLAFGVHMKTLTVTSNEGFIRSSKPVFIHHPRALTENKEKTATPL